jgi:hypothetical protein
MDRYLFTLQGTPDWLDLTEKWYRTTRGLSKIKNPQGVPLASVLRSRRPSDRLPDVLNLHLLPTEAFQHELTALVRDVVEPAYQSSDVDRLFQGAPGPFRRICWLLRVLGTFYQALAAHVPVVENRLLCLLSEEIPLFFRNKDLTVYDPRYLLQQRRTGQRVINLSLCFASSDPGRIGLPDQLPGHIPGQHQADRDVFLREARRCLSKLYLPVFMACTRGLHRLVQQYRPQIRTAMLIRYYRDVDPAQLKQLHLGRKYLDRLTLLTLYHPQSPNVRTAADEICQPRRPGRTGMNREELEAVLRYRLLALFDSSPPEFDRYCQKNLVQYHRHALDHPLESTRFLRSTLARIVRRVPVDELQNLVESSLNLKKKGVLARGANFSK